MKRTGYSIIELIIVVGVTILIASFGIARYNDFNERQAVQQAADTLVSDLRFVQAKALAGEKPRVGTCTTLLGYRVTFDQKNYTMQAICSEGPVDGTQVTIDLPGNVNIWPIPTPVTYYALGHGTSGDITVNVVGKSITVPVVLAANSISKQSSIVSVVTPTTPTPTPYSCPWPAGDPRCGP